MHVTVGRDAAIVSLARRRHGVVTTAELLDAGFSEGAVRRLVAKGWLRRLHRGVYLVGALESPLTRSISPSSMPIAGPAAA
jgi:predicted transcriptional regulator of viral defense system